MNVNWLIVDENELDVVYRRKLEGKSKKNGYQKKVARSAPPLASKFFAPPLPSAPSRNPSAPPPPPPIKAAAAIATQTKNDELSSSGSGVLIKHWDKVNKNNSDHSMVWEKLHSRSFR
ncbi:hypothetical protein LINPERPRIM_LOCUS1262 [Linum perenne]